MPRAVERASLEATAQCCGLCGPSPFLGVFACGGGRAGEVTKLKWKRVEWCLVVAFLVAAASLAIPGSTTAAGPPPEPFATVDAGTLGGANTYVADVND